MAEVRRLDSRTPFLPPSRPTGSLLLSLLALSILSGPSALEARSFKSEVVHVADGDTITVVDKDRRRSRVRLRAIDAPEISQPYGRIAQETLASKISGRTVRIDYSHRDRYGRILADVFLDDRLINREMLDEGLAWHYRRFHNSPVFDSLVESAKESRLGLWKSPYPIRPDIWRRRHPKFD